MTIEEVKALLTAMAKADNHPDPEAWVGAVVDYLSNPAPKVPEPELVPNPEPSPVAGE